MIGMQLNPHGKPPEYLRCKFKQYRKRRGSDLDNDREVIDLSRYDHNAVTEISSAAARNPNAIFRRFLDEFGRVGSSSPRVDVDPTQPLRPFSGRAFEIMDVPGLTVYPSLLPVEVQTSLLHRLFHRDLANSQHLTNVHLHHDIDCLPGGGSFFDASPGYMLGLPKDLYMHKPMSAAQLLNKKLRWMTLGGQYDWTSKIYPAETPPEFPPDIADLLQGLFPHTTPEAAIVNLYSPGDTLSMHRDVSEESDRPLISISIGCDGLFIIGLDPEEGQGEGRFAVLRLRSGDAVYMAGQSRFAWHGVPAIIPHTCPPELRDWPYEDDEDEQNPDAAKYKEWRGWLASKRINLNVRQMKDHDSNVG